MTESTIEEQQIISRLMDYLERSNEKIVWHRLGWGDGREYQGGSLTGKVDTDFTQTRYSAFPMSSEIDLSYTINWGDTSWFSMRFTKWARIGLKPQPQEIVIFSKGEKEYPIFQARYSGWACEFDEANVAMQDFADNGQRLAEYFENMRDESVKQYLGLVQKVKQFKDAENILHLG